MSTVRTLSYVTTIAISLSVAVSSAHEGHDHGKAKPKPAEGKTKMVDGQGEWKFRYRPDLSHVPVDQKFLLKAHGGFAVDRKGPFADQKTYFGLPGVGLLEISHDLQDITVVGGDERIFNGQKDPGKAWNYHNCAAVYNGDELHLGLPGNNSGKIWIVTPEGKLVTTFGAPDGASGNGPTDLLQVPKSGVIKVTYGYGDNRIYEADPFSGETGLGLWNPGSFGGRGPRTKLGVYNTPHGITMFPNGSSIIVADRGHGRLQQVSLDGKSENVLDLKVPGTKDSAKQWPNPCDVDFSPDGSVALVGNLNGIGGSTSTFQIIDVKTGKTLSTVTPQLLGVPNSRHIHNAVFRFVDDRGIYVICLFWNPGGYGVFELVQ